MRLLIDRQMKNIVLALIFLWASTAASSTAIGTPTGRATTPEAQTHSRPWFVLGDSIVTVPSDGTPNDLPFSLIARERDVTFISLGGPGAQMGASNDFGFNGPWVTEAFNHVCGYFSYCEGVVIQAGVNDFGLNMPWPEQQSSIRRVLDWAEAHDKKVLMLDLIWHSEQGDGDVSGAPNAVGYTFRQLRDNRRAECLARASICSFAERPTLFDQATASLYVASEVARGTYTHLNPRGRRVYATWVEDAAARAGLF